MPAQAQFAVLRRGLKIQSAREFVVERKVAYVNGGVDYRRIQRARSLQGKVGAALHRQAVQMNLANARYIEIFPHQIKPEAARRRRIGGAPRNRGILMGKMNVVERSFTPGNPKIGIEVFDRFTIRRGIRRVNVSLRPGMRPRACNLNRDVRRPRNRIIEPGQSRRRRHVHIVQVHSRRVGAVLRELPILQRGADLEIGARVPAPQRAAAQRKLLRRELNAGRQRIPMHLLLRCSRGRRHGEFESLPQPASRLQLAPKTCLRQRH